LLPRVLGGVALGEVTAHQLLHRPNTSSPAHYRRTLLPLPSHPPNRPCLPSVPTRRPLSRLLPPRAVSSHPAPVSSHPPPPRPGCRPWLRAARSAAGPHLCALDAAPGSAGGPRLRALDAIPGSAPSDPSPAPASWTPPPDPPAAPGSAPWTPSPAPHRRIRRRRGFVGLHAAAAAPRFVHAVELLGGHESTRAPSPLAAYLRR
jgi:hypothetical protein